MNDKTAVLFFENLCALAGIAYVYLRRFQVDDLAFIVGHRPGVRCRYINVFAGFRHSVLNLADLQSIRCRRIWIPKSPNRKRFSGDVVKTDRLRWTHAGDELEALTLLKFGSSYNTFFRVVETDVVLPSIERNNIDECFRRL